eukprot:Amastigsp_a842443_36.p2 type:complete len:136 gc:universal Amastigsp_a842443_36:461-54(-)
MLPRAQSVLNEPAVDLERAKAGGHLVGEQKRRARWAHFVAADLLHRGARFGVDHRLERCAAARAQLFLLLDCFLDALEVVHGGVESPREPRGEAIALVHPIAELAMALRARLPLAELLALRLREARDPCRQRCVT